MSSTRKTPRSPSSAKNSVGVVVAVAAVAAAAAAALGGDVAPSARRKHLSPTLTGAERGGRLDQRRPGHLMCYLHCLPKRNAGCYTAYYASEAFGFIEKRWRASRLTAYLVPN